ncbi:hypothetical protein, partial [Aeromonas veronii]|uniref:hypothetical protein n=1 Tax=Aeromonas veronii TaxID=654 RepID=UPI003BA2D8AB
MTQGTTDVDRIRVVARAASYAARQGIIVQLHYCVGADTRAIVFEADGTAQVHARALAVAIL